MECFRSLNLLYGKCGCKALLRISIIIKVTQIFLYCLLLLGTYIFKINCEYKNKAFYKVNSGIFSYVGQVIQIKIIKITKSVFLFYVFIWIQFQLLMTLICDSHELNNFITIEIHTYFLILKREKKNQFVEVYAILRITDFCMI